MICNRSLLAIVPIAVASGIALECLHGEALGLIGNEAIIQIHIAASAALTGLVAWHLQLNWGSVRSWLGRYRKHRSKVLKLTAIVFAITSITGAVSIPLWLHHGHFGFGGIHGKFGILSAILMLLHIAKHRHYFLPPRH